MVAMNLRVATRIAIGVMATNASLMLAAGAQNGPYMSDLPKLYPATYTLWTQSLPYALGPLADWLASFKGVVSPIRDVSVNGTSMKFGTTCMPHDCGGNIAGALFSPPRNRIVAVVRLASKNGGSNVMIIGSMTNAEFACAQRLIDDHESTQC
jgi:Inhibitor of vertebrate lysozyme (Ivy)